MGRKQNPLVVEFFQRGAKLSNSSNRYACTCRRCGEQFPKGRTEALMSHVLKRCPNVSLEEQQWVFQRIQQTPERRSGNKQATVNDLNAITRQDRDPHAAFPESKSHHQSALDTLAEVSRRHLDYSAERAPSDVDRHINDRALSEILAEQALLTELRGHAHNGSSGDSTQTANSSLNKAKDSPPPGHRANGSHLTDTTVLDTSPLVQTASAANHQLEIDLAHNTSKNRADSLVDPQLEENRESDPHGGAQIVQNPSENTRTLSRKRPSEMVTQPHVLGLPTVLETPESRLRLLQKSIPSKKRGRFDDTRRKEVWDIRKRGACIRCRMLKKPCSGETPCSTCSAVESGRLWKGKCLRTRLSEECTLWSMKFFHSRASVDLSAAGREHTQVPLPGRIEARLFPRSTLCLSFAAKARANTVDGIDPTLRLHPGRDANESDNLLLSNEDEILTDRLGEYANRVANICTQEEPSRFVRSTLQLTLKLAHAEESDKAMKAVNVQEQQSPRSSYNVQDELLKNVAELWVLTQFLVPKGPQVLQLRYDPLKMPQKEPYESNLGSDDHEHAAGYIAESSRSWATIESQLLAAVESRCSKLSKIVMNELERRLLQRQQVSRFATFLSAVILLSCVERMCSLFRVFDKGETPSPQPSDAHVDDTSQPLKKARAFLQSSAGDEKNTAFHNGDSSKFWPLDVPPSGLWQQGQHFSELLVMLLRMRALLPKTRQNPDGTLSTAQDFSVPNHFRGQSMKDRIEEQTESVAALLDPLGLNVNELIRKRDGELAHQSEEAWNMRLVSKLLLPETIS